MKQKTHCSELGDFTSSNKHINKTFFPFDEESFWEKQFGRWFNREDSILFASRAAQITDFIKNKVPPCVIFTLVAAWSNGWATGRRFQNKLSRCCIHNECDGEDSIEHYGECIEPWIAFRSITGIHLQQNFETFIVVGSGDSQSWIFLACHLYAVKRAADLGRRTSCPCSSAFQVRKLVRDGYKVAASHCKGLACRYDALWKEHVDVA